MSNPLSYVDQLLDDLRAQGLFRKMAEFESPQGNRVVLRGKEVIQLSSNNYLGLATHSRLREAASRAALQWGAGTASVRTIAGTMSIHEALERELAAFKQTEGALVFQSGFTANVGVITSLLDEQDIVISDSLNHASIIDGIRLTKAARKIYKHKDVADLERALMEATHEGKRAKLVVTDGVFSMDGDIAPLPAIVDVCEKYGAIVMVDDAHASGVLGKNGRGTVDHFGLHGRVHIQVGTLSKAIGVLGGYVASTANVRDLLIHRARPFLFSTSHPPAVTEANREALRVLVDEPELIERLWSNARYFKAELAKLGFDTGESETPITPVLIGSGRLAMAFSDRLLDYGVYAQGIGFPTVPDDKSRVRTIVTAEHTQVDLELAIEAFERAGHEFDLI